MASAAELPVDLVEEIFLHLDDAADLVRASAACAAFRRVVSDGRFLRRFRSLHRPPVLGLLRRGLRFHPAAPPRRSALTARAIARAAGFSSSSFLPVLPADHPTEHCWRLHDARGGRVLLSPSRLDIDAARARTASFSYLVVYHPLNHKHVRIPPIPNHVVACTHGCCYCEFDQFLFPAAADDGDDPSFKVMCTARLPTRSNVLETFVYSSITGKWCGMASLSETYYNHVFGILKGHYAHGCFYWVHSYHKGMLVLDMNRTKFSTIRLPPETDNKFKAVVKAAEEDRVGLLVLSDNTLHLYTKPVAFGGASNDDDDDDGCCCQWRRDALVTLLDSYVWFFGGAADDQGYALLLGIPRDEYLALGRSPEMMPTSAHYFTVELPTLLVEELCVTEFSRGPAFLYASFPPWFVPPSL